MSITQQGLIVAPTGAHAIIAEHAPAAYKIRSFVNNAAPSTWQKMRRALNLNGFACESRFDAAHGGRYMLLVYCGPEQRKECFDFLCRPGQ